MSIRKKFNTTGTCIPEKHFTANVEGKTTIQYLLWRRLSKLENYSVIQISFEEIDTVGFESAERFVAAFYLLLKDYAQATNYVRLLEFLEKLKPDETQKLNSPWNIAAEFNVSNTIIQKGLLYGVFRRADSLKIHNRVYEQYIQRQLKLMFIK